MIKTLIRYGVDIESRTLEGKTSLHLSCLMGNYYITKLLVENSANMNSIDN